jgi:hypothetical protein
MSNRPSRAAFLSGSFFSLVLMSDRHPTDSKKIADFFSSKYF